MTDDTLNLRGLLEKTADTDFLRENPVFRCAAECARSTVAEALKALEWAGVPTWQNRITRILVRERDLFGQWASCWQVIRNGHAKSNAFLRRNGADVARAVPWNKAAPMDSRLIG